MNSFNNSDPEGNPKFTELNPSISSIGVNPLKSDFQDFSGYSMQDTTKNMDGIIQTNLK